jgi:hypothetical protein
LLSTVKWHREKEFTLKRPTKLVYLFGAALLVAIVFAAAHYPQAQAQDSTIVGTWNIGTDVIMSFHADGTVATVTEFSLTHPDTPQLGIWWQEGDVIHWLAQGFTLSGEATTSVTVNGIVEINSSDEISVDPLVEIIMPDGSTFVDDPPLATGTRIQPVTGS